MMEKLNASTWLKGKKQIKAKQKKKREKSEEEYKNKIKLFFKFVLPQCFCF